jgi:hypothetical protein
VRAACARHPGHRPALRGRAGSGPSASLRSRACARWRSACRRVHDHRRGRGRRLVAGRPSAARGSRAAGSRRRSSSWRLRPCVAAP